MASGAVVTLTVIVTPDRGPAAGEVMDDASEVPHASDAQRWCRPELAENGARGRHHLGHEGGMERHCAFHFFKAADQLSTIVTGTDRASSVALLIRKR